MIKNRSIEFKKFRSMSDYFSVFLVQKIFLKIENYSWAKWILPKNIFLLNQDRLYNMRFIDSIKSIFKLKTFVVHSTNQFNYKFQSKMNKS